MAHFPTSAQSFCTGSAMKPTLTDEINAATRKQHTELNAFITACLPLALPPNASNPAVLGHGLAAFAHIFRAFETAWDRLEDIERGRARSQQRNHKEQVMHWISNLRPEGLARLERIENDVKYISTTTVTEQKSTIPRLKSLSRIDELVAEKPHLLFAYAWVYYMAIFSGGRWIRRQFVQAGPQFWTGFHGTQAESVIPGFSFLLFDGKEDGEDIKREFKMRLTDAEHLLTTQERREVVNASVQIFDDCMKVVHHLNQSPFSIDTASPGLPYGLLLGALIAIMAILFYWNTGHIFHI